MPNNKTVRKGALTVATGAAPRVAGLGSFALGSEQDPLPSAPLSAGGLSLQAQTESRVDESLDAATTSWEPESNPLVPGATVEVTVPLTATAVGKNLAGRVATWLNRGAGANDTRWAAYTVIAVGALRTLIGLRGPLPRGRVRFPGDRARTSGRRTRMMMGALFTVLHPATGPATHLSRRSQVVPLAQRPPTGSREHVSVPADWGKNDEADPGKDEDQDSRRWRSRGAWCEFPTHGRAVPSSGQRQALTVGAVAARIEYRLYSSEPTLHGVDDGCELAIRQGLSSVIVPPEMVPLVGLRLAGTSVGLVTVLGWRNGEVEPLAASALRGEACRLVAEGATDVAVLADVDRLEADRGRQLADDVTALVEVAQARGARVRVVLDTDRQTPAATTAACELLGATGAWLVQGGSWCGGRTGLSRIQLMRAALPDEVRLKWTLPIRTLDAMMIGIAEGVDLYNGDPISLLDDAARRVSAGPLLVPVPGVDY